MLLDLDGTIADSIDFFYDLTCELLTEAGVPLPGRTEVLEAISFGVPPSSRFLPEDYPDRDAYLARLYTARWSEWVRRYEEGVAPLPGACEAVQALAERGFRLALVTSSPGELPFLDRWGIRKFFGAIVRREDVRRLKPHPEPLLSALLRLSLSPAEALGVGDSDVDVRAGRAAGIATVGVLTGAGTAEQLRAAGATAILPSIADLPAFLEGLRS